MADIVTDREEALRDDFHLETTYDYGEDDEWDENEANWNGEEEEHTEEETLESKDESKAYLEFLNDEVRNKPTSAQFTPTKSKLTPVHRPRNIVARLRTSTTTSWARIVFCWTRRSIRLSRTSCSRPLC